MITPRSGAAGPAAALVVVLGVAGSAAACSSSTTSQGVAAPVDEARPSVLAVAERWAAPPPLEGRRLLQPADLDQALPGADRWHEAAVDMQPAWLRRQCERGPVGDDSQPTAAAGARPSGEVTQAWMRGGVVTPDPGEFATTEALRWSDGPGGGDGGGGEQAAAAWVADVAAEASRCEGAVVVDPLEPSDAAPSGAADVVVVARPHSSAADATWSAVALVAAGPTAVEVSASDAGTSAEAAGEAVTALLEVTAAQLLAADDAVALSGVGERAVAAFSEHGDETPLLFPGGSTPDLPLITGADLATAFPDASRWQAGGRAGTAGDWRRSWCDRDRALSVGGGEPDQIGDLFEGEGTASSGRPARVLVDVDVKRWQTPSGSADVSTAYDWAAAVRDDAADCAGARPTAVGALPGSVASAAAVSGGTVLGGEDDGWRVAVTTVSGSTAVQVRVQLADGAASDADAAATSAAALARRVVANVVRADAAALGAG